MTLAGAIDLNLIDPKDKCRHSDDAEHSQACWKLDALDLLIDLYLAGDFLGDVVLRNATMDMVLWHFRHWGHPDVAPFTCPQIDTIWKHTPGSSTLRNCVLDSIIASGQALTVGSDEVERWNNQFLIELSNRQLEFWAVHDRAKLRDLSQQKCFYHDHIDGQACPLSYFQIGSTVIVGDLGGVDKVAA